MKLNKALRYAKLNLFFFTVALALCIVFRFFAVGRDFNGVSILLSVALVIIYGGKVYGIRKRMQYIKDKKDEEELASMPGPMEMDNGTG